MSLVRGNNIPLLPQASLRDWPRRTRRSAKRHVVKKLRELQVNYYSSTNIYKETIIYWKILADNMFR